MKFSFVIILIVMCAMTVRAEQQTRSSGGIDLTTEGATFLGLNVGFLNHSTATTQGSSTVGNYGTAESLTNVDVNVGYVFYTGIYLGGTYLTESSSSSNATTSTKTNQTAFGLSAGYFLDGFLLIGHYYFSSVYRDLSASNTWTKPLAGGVDVGYLFRVLGPLRIGGVLSYRYFDYQHVDQSGVGASADLKMSPFDPKLVVELVF